MASKRSRSISRFWRASAAALLLCAALPALGNPQRQDPQAIEAAAEHFLREQLAAEYDYAEVAARGVDSRLNLAACDDELQAFVPHGRDPLRASTIGVNCQGTAPWTVYVRMEVTAKTDVVVAAHPLRRGDRLRQSDVRLEHLNVRRIRGTAFRDIDSVINLEVQRTLREGTPITIHTTDQPALVRRGNDVVIEAPPHDTIQITSRGRALENGRKGDRIRIENLDSGREIEADVIGDHRVRAAR